MNSSGYAPRAIVTPMATVPRQRLDGAHMPGLPKLQRKANRQAAHHEHNGRKLTVAEWSVVTGIRAATIHRRLHKGWPVSFALTAELCRPGVAAIFPQPVGTGGGPTTQDFTEIEFSH